MILKYIQKNMHNNEENLIKERGIKNLKQLSFNIGEKYW